MIAAVSPVSAFLQVLMFGCFVFGSVHYLSLALWALFSGEFMRSSRPGVRKTAMAEAYDEGLPGVSLVMPAYNEEVVIVDCVGAALDIDHPDLEVIVVSDGSKDRTIEVLVEAFNLRSIGVPADLGPIHCQPIRNVWQSDDRRLILVDKLPAGAKGDGSNCAINFSTKPWVVIMDADELVNPDVIVRCLTAAQRTEGNVVGVGVTLLPTNECDIENLKVIEPRVPKNPWVAFQLVEYLGAFMLSRPGLASIGALPLVSGGFGMFSRQALLNVGGYTHPHLGEDLDMVVRIHRWYCENDIDYKIVQVPEAVVWTEFPNTHEILRRQRIRWHRGLRQVVRANREVVFRPSYGSFGMIGMPIMWLFEWCSVFVETFGYALMIGMLATGQMRLGAIWPMLVASQTIGVCATTTAVALSSKTINIYRRPLDLARLFGFAIIGQFGFRQLTLVWRVRSLWGKNTVWGAMPRTGFAKPVKT